MSIANSVLIVSLGPLRLGMPVAAVQRLVRATEVTPLADAPASVPGIVNVHGRIVPVVDLRARFGLPTRAIFVDDHFLLVALPRRLLAVIVDEALDVLEFDPASLVPASDVLPWMDRIDGVLRLEDGLLLVTDPAAFLDVEEWRAVESAVENMA